MTSMIEKPQSNRAKTYNRFRGTQDHGSSQEQDGHSQKVHYTDTYWEQRWAERGAVNTDKTYLKEVISDGLSDYQNSDDDVATVHDRGFDDAVDELDELIQRYPKYRELDSHMMHNVQEYKDKWLDIDDLASFYRNFLSRKYNEEVSITDAHILIEELLHNGYGSEVEEKRLEDEAHEINDAINRVYSGGDRRSVNPHRPTNRTRNRNLVRTVERLTDGE